MADASPFGVREQRATSAGAVFGPAACRRRPETKRSEMRQFLKTIPAVQYLYGHYRLQRFRLDGSDARVIGGFGTGPGRFFAPRGLAVTDRAIYVADDGNWATQRLAP